MKLLKKFEGKEIEYLYYDCYTVQNLRVTLLVESLFMTMSK